MSKQAMGKLVDQCEAWGMVQRQPDPHDARARRVVFTATGLAWLGPTASGAQAEAELRQAVGDEVATVWRSGWRPTPPIAAFQQRAPAPDA
jgi:DNA-binding MarR family transcriptional regulator